MQSFIRKRTKNLATHKRRWGQADQWTTNNLSRTSMHDKGRFVMKELLTQAIMRRKMNDRHTGIEQLTMSTCAHNRYQGD